MSSMFEETRSLREWEELSDRLENTEFSIVSSDDFYVVGKRTPAGVKVLYEGPSAAGAYGRVIEEIMSVLELDLSLSEVTRRNVTNGYAFRKDDFGR